MDDQLLEIVGRHRLIESLLQADIEVAFPARDHGVDLIAYSDTDVSLGQFVGFPIQMKSASTASFSISQKYSKFPGMLLAYVWNVSERSNTQIYALTQEEAVRIATDMKYTATDSWIKHGTYVVTRPSPKLVELLRPFEVGKTTWKERLQKLSARKT
jgi:hypothetical protein